ncbi:MAG: tetratricopeptide repeat-containing sulfotransferase family protein [Jhaorihella sp.]
MTFQADLSAAQAHLQQGRFKPALKAARSALRKQPKSALAANIAGIALGRLGDHREAVAMFRKALKLDPGSADARRNLAQTLIFLGQNKSARALMQRQVDASAGDAGAWYLLAQAELALGDAVAAETAATRCIAADPRQSRALNLRALIRDRMGLLPEAIADYEAALAINPDDVEALANMALPLARQLRDGDALTALRRAVALAPGHAGARLRLAMHLAQSGAREDAIAAFRELLDMAPGHPEAIEQLAGLQDAADNRTLEPQARAALKSAPRRSEARASLNFALSRMAEQSGDSRAAAALLADANGDMAARLPYDATADAAQHADLLERFDDPVAAAPPVGDDPRPVYVLGLPRSGTTLCEAVMGAHPAVAALGERAASGMLLQRIITEKLPFDASAVRQFIDADALMRPDLTPGTKIWVDKMPENYRLIGFLMTAYPRARIVNLTRDPRDVALSMWRGHFSGTALNYTYDMRAMAHRFNLYAQAMAHWRQVFPRAIMDLAYEDLVRDVEAASRRLAGFCGLEWHPEMARPDRTAGQILTLSAAQLRQPVHARSIGGWRAHADELAPFIAGLDPGLWPQIR